MDGNGRWAQQRGLKRTKEHERGEAVLMERVDACLRMGAKHLSVYAFSAKNWRRSVDEVRFLMGFNRGVLRRRRDELDSKSVRVRWAGRRPRLWRSVIRGLEIAEEQTKNNDVLALYMCVNYSGRTEIIDAVRGIARQAAAGELSEYDLTEKSFAQLLDEPTTPDIDPFLRPPGEQCTSNFLIWQSACTEMIYQDKLFPDFGRDDIRAAVVEYAKHDRRSGKVQSWLFEAGDRTTSSGSPYTDRKLRQCAWSD